MNVLPEPEGAAVASFSSHLYVDLRGTIEILGNDAFITVGQFDTALFLLPDLASIASGIVWLRQGSPKLEIRLLESPSLWFVREGRGSKLVELRYVKNAIKGLTVQMIDEAIDAAVNDYLAWLTSIRPGKGVDAAAMQYLETIASAWPSIEKFVDPWRRHVDRY